MTAPHVVAEVPAGWTEADVAPPPIASNARLTQWSVRHAEGEGSLAIACAQSPIPGWVEDMRLSIAARTVAFSGAIAERLTGSPMDARPEGPALFALRPAKDLAGEPVGHAKTFLGFDDGAVVACTAVCIGPREQPSRPCDRPVVAAELVASKAPPPPGLVLRSVTWGIHHPGPVATGGSVAIVVLACAALAFRRKPRFR